MIAHAQDVRSTKFNTMVGLLPISMPWHCMLCPHRARVGPSSVGMTLPDIVAASLSTLKSEDAGDRRPIEPGEPPEWVDLLQRLPMPDKTTMASGEPTASESALNKYLKEHELFGLVLFSGSLED